jgi:hypothetical protein
MNGAFGMKLQYGKRMKAKFLIHLGLFTAFFNLCISNVHASFCRCKPENWEDFRIFVAPQIARLKLTIKDFAIYRGVFKGGSAQFEYKPFCDFYCGVFAEWMMGSCDSKKEMSRYIHDIDAQVRLGYNFPMWNFYKLTFTPFFGLGYEELIHHIRPDLVLTSEKFHYQHYYLPYGAVVEFRLSRTFGVGLVGENTRTIDQELKTPYIQGIKFKLHGERGYLIQFPFDLYFGEGEAKAQISIIPYLKSVVDGRLAASLPDGATLTLPKQTYRFWGLRLAIGAVF